MSIGSFEVVQEDGESNDTDDSSWENMSANDTNLVPSSPQPLAAKQVAKTALSASDFICAPFLIDSDAGTPIRKIKLYEDSNDNAQNNFKSGKGRRNKKSRTVVVHSSEVSTL